MNEYPCIRAALVVEDDDSSRSKDSKKGAVQVRIYPELAEMNKGDLPWATSKDGAGGFGSSGDFGQHRVPMKDSIVYVEIQDPAYQYVYYLPEGPHSYSKYIYDKGKGNIDIDGYSAPSYPEPQLKVLPESTTLFFDRKTGDMGVQHSSGLYVYISKEGDLKIKFIKKFLLQLADGSDYKFAVDDTGKLEITAKDIILKADTIEMGDTSPDNHVALYEPLEKILEDLLKHIHVSPGPGPTTPAMDSTQSPLASKIGDLTKIKSSTTKAK